MPVTVPRARPTTAPPPPVELIRMFLRDVPGRIPGSGSENILLPDVEFSNAEISFALQLAVSRFNSSRPPITPLAPGAIPLDILLGGVTAYLMGSESFRQARNQASANAGDVALGIDDKHSLYAGLRKFLMDEFDQKLTEWKVARNMAAGWGGVSSSYGWGWYRGWYGGWAGL